ncbi:MAG: hypothetical protein WC681_18975, partial [Sterolibacterium sp.]|jgi:hypothetical protein
MMFPDFSEEFSVTGFLSCFLYFTKPRSGLSTYIVFAVRELQSYLRLAKLFKYGKMIHLLRAGHCETLNFVIGSSFAA